MYNSKGFQAANVGRRKASGRIFVRGASAGFTLLELLVTLSIAGILLTIVIPRIDVARFQLDAAVQEVASSASSTRGQALLRQHDLVLTFDEAGDRFYVLYDANSNGQTDTGEQRTMVQLSTGVKFGRGGAPALSGFEHAISLTRESDGLPALTFHRNGAASEEGVIYLSSVRAAIADRPEDARALMVVRSTGRVRCYSYRTLAWLEGC